MLSHARLLFKGTFLVGTLLASHPVKAEISEMELRLNQPYKKWAKLEKRAAELGLHTSLKGYRAAHPSPKPRLFLDTEIGRELVKEQLEIDATSKEFQTPKFYDLPDAGFDHDAGVEWLRNNLETPLPDNATNADVYKALLAQLAPHNQRLDHFKAAIQQSQSLGHIYSRECDLHFPSFPIGQLSHQLMLRGVCAAGLGKTDYSDHAAVGKLIKLTKSTQPNLLSISVSVALQMAYQPSLGFLIRQPNTDIQSIAKLMRDVQLNDSHSDLTQALRYEYTLQLEGMTAIVEGNPYPEWKYSETKLADILADHSKLQLLAARHELAEFSLKQLFKTTTTAASAHTLSTWTPSSKLLQKHPISASSSKLVKTYTEGVDFYFESYAEADLLLNLESIANAFHLYHLDHGSYPDEIKELVPKYLSSIPINEFTESTYKYLPETDTDNPLIKGTITLPSKGEVSQEVLLSY